MSARRGAAAGVLPLLLIVAVLLPVQAQAQWSVEAQAGRLRGSPGALPARDGAFALGLRHDSPVAGLRLSAGIPAAEADPLWAALGGWTRAEQRLGRLRAGVDLAGQASVLRGRDGGIREIPGLFGARREIVPASSATAFTGQALPLVAVEAGRVRLQARGGVAYYTVTQGEASADRAVRIADLQLTLLPTDALALSPVLRRFMQPDGVTEDYAGASAVAVSGPVTVAGSVGSWLNRDAAALPWSVSVTLRPAGRFSVTGAARRDSYDPVTLQPEATAWSVALGVRVGAAPPAVVPPVALPAADGRVTLRIAARDVDGAPRVAGDFNGWTPQPMTRAGDDWALALALGPGVYSYAFVDPDGGWFVPDTMPGRRDDGMGGHVAVLVVP